VFQAFNLFRPAPQKHHSSLEKVHGHSARDAENRARSAGQIPAQLMPQKPAELSGGQRQRVATSARCRSAAAAAFDEPTSTLIKQRRMFSARSKLREVEN
jgi:ABC-type polar amino acid transport system ATPase subunit